MRCEGLPRHKFLNAFLCAQSRPGPSQPFRTSQSFPAALESETVVRPAIRNFKDLRPFTAGNRVPVFRFLKFQKPSPEAQSPLPPVRPPPASEFLLSAFCFQSRQSQIPLIRLIHAIRRHASELVPWSLSPLGPFPKRSLGPLVPWSLRQFLLSAFYFLLFPQ